MSNTAPPKFKLNDWVMTNSEFSKKTNDFYIGNIIKIIPKQTYYSLNDDIVWLYHIRHDKNGWVNLEESEIMSVINDLDKTQEKTSQEIEAFILEQYEKVITEHDNFKNDLVNLGAEMGEKSILVTIGSFIGIDNSEFSEIEGMYIND